MFLGALPWTYWMALPLLVGSAMVFVAFTLVYLKKVVEPQVLRLDALLAARTGVALAQPVHVSRLHGARGSQPRH